MSRPRFLADEDLRGSIVRAVRRIAPTLEMITVGDACDASEFYHSRNSCPVVRRLAVAMRRIAL